MHWDALARKAGMERRDFAMSKKDETVKDETIVVESGHPLGLSASGR